MNIKAVPCDGGCDHGWTVDGPCMRCDGTGKIPIWTDDGRRVLHFATLVVYGFVLAGIAFGFGWWGYAKLFR